jgi:hypothetical protein
MVRANRNRSRVAGHDAPIAGCRRSGRVPPPGAARVSTYATIAGADHFVTPRVGIQRPSFFRHTDPMRAVRVTALTIKVWRGVAPSAHRVTQVPAVGRCIGDGGSPCGCVSLAARAAWRVVVVVAPSPSVQSRPSVVMPACSSAVTDVWCRARIWIGVAAHCSVVCGPLTLAPGRLRRSAQARIAVRHVSGTASMRVVPMMARVGMSINHAPILWSR